MRREDLESYPPSIVPANHVAPVPRRIRGYAGGRVVFDTLRALYVWEWPPYPQYYIPRGDVDTGLLTARGEPHRTPQGTVREHDLRTGVLLRERTARLVLDSTFDGVAGTVRSQWTSLDQWLEPAISFTTDLFAWPSLRATIPDSHFAARDRFGRLAAFLARIVHDGLAPVPFMASESMKATSCSWTRTGRRPCERR